MSAEDRRRLDGAGGSTAARPMQGNFAVAVGVTLIAGLAVAVVIYWSSRRGSKRSTKPALTHEEWESLFTPDGKLIKGGVDLLERVRISGVDQSIRSKVWPFLLGVYDLDSTESMRNAVRTKCRKDYEALRKHCKEKHAFKPEREELVEDKSMDTVESVESIAKDNAKSLGVNGSDNSTSVGYQDELNLQEPSGGEQGKSEAGVDLEGHSDAPATGEAKTSGSAPSDENLVSNLSEGEENSVVTNIDSLEKGALSGDEHESLPTYSAVEGEIGCSSETSNAPGPVKKRTAEDFATWQRIIRLDAIRANDEWRDFSRSQGEVSMEKAIECAKNVSLQDYGHLEAHRIYHASRLVAILEAYAIYDSEIGYCQGMSDLLAPIITFIEEDDMAFWCFVGFMKKARHNFRIDEVGIRRQLSMVSKIIKLKDPQFYKHLEKLQAEDCFFVYRMVVVMFRRELTFAQTVSVWEVMWADQTARRSGIREPIRGKTGRVAPPTDDLLLYAIAASVLHRRKVIIESYSSVDELILECNNMVGRLDVWKLLDDAHNLVTALHNKIQ